LIRHALCLCLCLGLLACSASPLTDPADAAIGADLSETASPSGSNPQPDAAQPQDTAPGDPDTLPDPPATHDATTPEDALSQDAATSQDTAAPEADVAIEDAVTTPADIGMEDSSPPEIDTPIDDTSASEDSQGAEAGSTEPTCEGVLATAEALLASAGAGCGAPDSCVMFEFPICGSFGCFSGAMREDAPEETHAALNDAALSGMNAGCEPFHCGCGFPEGTPVCLQAQCRMCPGDCGDSCEDVEDAIQVAATKLALGCESDEDCAVLPVAPCDLGTAIQCHGLPYRVGVGADLGPVQKLLEGAEEVGCSTFQCDCQLTESICSGGTCVPGL
jgi:hypothetical protein